MNTSIEKNRMISIIIESVFGKYKFMKAKSKFNESMIRDLYYEMENVKGIDYTKERSTFNKDRYDDVYFRLSEKIDDLERENRFLNDYFGIADSFLESITNESLKKRINDKYIK